MRDRFVVITRRRRRRDGKSRKTSGLASLSPREQAAVSEMEKQGTQDGEGRRKGIVARARAEGEAGGNAEGEKEKERDQRRGRRRRTKVSQGIGGMTGQGSEAFGQRDGGGSEPITYYNCLASERSERGAPVRHPSSRRMASLPITSAVIANFSRPCLAACLPLASRSTPPPPTRRLYPLHDRRRLHRRATCLY